MYKSAQSGFAQVLVLFLLLVAIILVIGVSGYFLYQKQATKPAVVPQRASQPAPSPNPDQTANWQTYTNNAAKFSLKIPSEMSAIGIGNNPADANYVAICNNCKSSDDLSKIPSLFIQASGAFANWSLDDIVKKPYDSGTKNGDIIVTTPLHQINYAGEPAYSYTLSTDSPVYHEESQLVFGEKAIEVKHNGVLYILRSTEDPIFDQILSTFKFTDKGQMEAAPVVSRCDLNSDGQCNAADRTIFQKAFGSHRGNINYNPLADADADGSITAVDEQILFPVTLPADSVSTTNP